MGAMEREHEPHRTGGDDHAQARREREAQDRLLDLGADRLETVRGMGYVIEND